MERTGGKTREASTSRAEGPTVEATPIPILLAALIHEIQYLLDVGLGQTALLRDITFCRGVGLSRCQHSLCPPLFSSQVVIIKKVEVVKRKLQEKSFPFPHLMIHHC